MRRGCFGIFGRVPRHVCIFKVPSFLTFPPMGWGTLEHTFLVSGLGFLLPSSWNGYPGANLGNRDLESIISWQEALRGPAQLDMTTLYPRELQQWPSFLRTMRQLPPHPSKGVVYWLCPSEDSFLAQKVDALPWWKGRCSRQHGARWAYLLRTGGSFSHKDPICSFQERMSQSVQKQVVKIFFQRHLISFNSKCS